MSNRNSVLQFLIGAAVVIFLVWLIPLWVFGLAVGFGFLLMLFLFGLAAFGIFILLTLLGLLPALVVLAGLTASSFLFDHDFDRPDTELIDWQVQETKFVSDVPAKPDSILQTLNRLV